MIHYLIAVVIAAGLWAWVVAHQLIIAFIYASLVERLPPPDATSGKVYAYIYSVLQFFAANTQRLQDALKAVRTVKDVAPPTS